ncbi:enoyl-CoA hydratase/isomerase family protein [Phototrophicus methaneseepsis]|uniref:Enoyl-CoA hydratase/isomerase family protein n=1 Tax=Phototrophicus methaneseepsis TaxID=2710758 RepID=A0A7S8ICI8_9CHLR|nr:enoyl-CoA hydratase-related protein [Phototrophicus methaneseepsis]QPC81600.1 enoyl-CoA hydratase/isomerase family protein [Phototrophicus methaneseepsis]
MKNLLDNPQTLLIDIQGYVAYITLHRPQAKNAMNYAMIGELFDVFTALKSRPEIRAVVLSGAEGTFCAGGDIKEMRTSPVPASESACNLDAMLQAVNEAPQIVIAKIEGAALGGGLGLVCVSDVAISSETALFGLPEVRLGIAPSFISPYVLARIGLTRSRELMLTGRRFKGAEALNYGLVHQCCPADELDNAVAAVLADIQQCAPGAIAAIKALIFEVADKPPEVTLAYRADLLNALRAGEEAQEGMQSFSQKRPPKWSLKDES